MRDCVRLREGKWQERGYRRRREDHESILFWTSQESSFVRSFSVPLQLLQTSNTHIEKGTVISRKLTYGEKLALLDYIPMSKLGMFYNVISTFLLMSQRCGFTVARLFFVPISAKSVPKNILRTKHYFSCQKCCGHFLSTYFK